MRKILDDAAKIVDDAIPVSGKVMYWVDTVGLILIIAVGSLLVIGLFLENPFLFGLMAVVFWHIHRTTKDHVKEHHKTKTEEEKIT